MSLYRPHEVEKQVSEKWKRDMVYEKVKKNAARGKPFYFIDGPPYASASIHIGTAWNKIIKDCYIRFWRMQGFNVWDQPGYDTHGTPIEVNVEKTLGFSSKKDIEKYGVGRFIQKCREFATKNIDTMNRQFADLGVWMDWKNPYLTLDNHYIEGAWYTFKKAFEKGFLYKGSYPVHVCTRCETVVAYNEVEHRTVSEKSVYVKFPVKGEKNVSLVIWTTTPWTLPANTGVMVHPDFEYAYVKVQATGEILIIAKELAEKVMTEIVETGNYKIVKTVKGKILEGTVYEHPLRDLVPALQNLKNAHRVVLSSRYVNLEAGTGLVHTAPGHGAEDFDVGRKEGLPVLSPVKLDGTFTSEAGKWLEGKYTKDMDHVIIEKLNERNVLLGTEEYSHEYPFCWRCDTPLLFLNVPQWFFKVTKVRKKFLEENKKVKWIPEWAGQRFDDWLKNLEDWPVSRQRYWGIPLPIWECTNPKCGNIEVIGSFEELKKKSGLSREIDFHRPDIDNVKMKCTKCGQEISRVHDVLDVWFDSGVCTWASLGYPRKKSLFEKMWPSDFQVEGPDQFRGWWNSQMITSVLTFNRAPFKNILLHGMVLDIKGKKMSKSKGGVAPEDVVEKYGRDVLRFYFLSFPPWDDLYFNWEGARETSRMFNIFWNVYEFVKTYVKSRPKSPGKLNIEDKWIISRINSLCEFGEHAGKRYRIHEFVKELFDFILNDFSRWYIKIIRNRVSPSYSGYDRKSAEYTLIYVLDRLVRITAPVSPFLSEKIWLDMFGRDSVHMQSWPKVEKARIDKKLEQGMELTEKITETIYALRQERKIKTRWPLDKVFLKLKNEKQKVLIKPLKQVLENMGNVKEVVFVRKLTGKKVSFEHGELALGKVLMNEALVRELIRKIQVLRKEARLDVHDKITLVLETDKKTGKLLKKYEAELLSGTGAKTVDLDRVEKPQGELVFEGKSVKIIFRKV